MVAYLHTPQTHVAPARRDDYSSPARYAIYFAPNRDSAWWRFGCAWLGRDPVNNTCVARPALPALEGAGVSVDTLERITAAPRGYGFHATLKAPFRLRAGYTADDVYAQAQDLAQSLIVVELPPVQLCVIDGFVALSFPRDIHVNHDSGTGSTPGVTVNLPAVNALAAQCVSAIDHLRAAPDARELARRHAAGLTQRQANLLAEWGYPYVFQEFRFHITLTGALPPQERQAIIDALAPTVARLNERPLRLDSLSIYWQPAPEAPFVVTRRYGFDGNIENYRDES